MGLQKNYIERSIGHSLKRQFQHVHFDIPENPVNYYVMEIIKKVNSWRVVSFPLKTQKQTTLSISISRIINYFQFIQFQFISFIIFQVLTNKYLITLNEKVNYSKVCFVKISLHNLKTIIFFCRMSFNVKQLEVFLYLNQSRTN